MAYTISDSTKTPFMVNSILALMISCNTLFPDEYDSLRRTFRDAGTGISTFLTSEQSAAVQVHGYATTTITSFLHTGIDGTMCKPAMFSPPGSNIWVPWQEPIAVAESDMVDIDQLLANIGNDLSVFE